MRLYLKIVCVIFIIFFQFEGSLKAQEAVVSGKVIDTEGQAIPIATITVEGTNISTSSHNDGSYKITVPTDTSITLLFSSFGYKVEKQDFLLRPGMNKTFDQVMEIEAKSLQEVYVNSYADKMGSMERISLKSIDMLPSVSGNIEDLIKTMPGVASNNELSSQFSVRGGNFDENLVYVNDIEVYRPFLIRTGQQEGLSFVNSDMVSSVKFSSGGFESKYGDKMSSVMDVSYRRPTQFGASATGSFLGGNVSVEGISKNKKFTINSGFRYKTSQYMLNTLETKGDYNPVFVDLQTFMTYDVSKSFSLQFLGNYAQNKYNFIPQTRETKFGTLGDVRSLVIYYDGREADKYNTYFGAFSGVFHPTDDLQLKLIASAFTTLEQEHFDIEGQYLINELDNTIGSKSYGDSLQNIGVGAMINHARNDFYASVVTLSHIGSYFDGVNQLKWGIKVQKEDIQDKLDEWDYVDSAGYASPYSGNKIGLQNAAYARNNISSIRFMTYIQNTNKLKSDWGEVYLNYGIRASHWDFNHELFLSPRGSISFMPLWQNKIVFRLAAGYYFQPPFYKEMRRRDGSINYNIKAQESIHFVGGSDYYLQIWDRPFIWTTEVYYKKLDNLIPYKVENVRVVYMADNIAKGYATGIDMKINGEFVKGAESWASLSIMQTREDIKGDFYTDDLGNKHSIGYYPRPTDQILNLGLFFQDYLPGNPTYRVHLTMFYGSSLPFSPPNPKRNDEIYRMPPYKRVDLGFSKLLKAESTISNGFFKHIKSAWLSAEIFNLLGVNNTISYLWINTVSNQEGMPNQFAVPNYLTSRRINLKLTLKF
jgi:hypothetical protein